jgi:hypothetical protein
MARAKGGAMTENEKQAAFLDELAEKTENATAKEYLRAAAKALREKVQEERRPHPKHWLEEVDP